MVTSEWETVRQLLVESAFKNVSDIVRLRKSEWISSLKGNHEQEQRSIGGKQSFRAKAYSGKWY